MEVYHQHPLGKRRKACEKCRSLKVQCRFEEADSSGCVNCTKFKRRCVFEDDRRNHKRNASDELRLQPAKSNRTSPSSPRKRGRAGPDSFPGASSQLGEPFAAIFPFLFSNDAQKSIPMPLDVAVRDKSLPDVIDRGILDSETASNIFNHFVMEMVPRLPFVALPHAFTSSKCRFKTPVLFLAILAAGSGMYPTDLRASLYDELYKVIADQVMYRGQKRLELVQAILVSFMRPTMPERLEDIRVGMMISLATTMALDLGLARTHDALGKIPGMSGPGSLASRRIMGVKGSDGQLSTSLEGRRTLLACYCACSMLASTLRRPTVLRINEHMSKSLIILETSPAAAPTDKTLVKWVELQRICSELAEATDTIPTGGPPSTEVALRRVLASSFESRLAKWKEDTIELLAEHETLLIEYHFVLLQANLLGLSEGRRPFGPPFTTDTLSPGISASDISAIGKSVSSAQAILDTLLSIPAVDITSLSTVVFPRVAFSILILIKAASTIASSYGGDSEHGTLKETHFRDFAVIEYCEKVIKLFQASKEPAGGCSNKMATFLTLLKGWFAKRILNESSSTESGSNEPSIGGPVHHTSGGNAMRPNIHLSLSVSDSSPADPYRGGPIYNASIQGTTENPTSAPELMRGVYHGNSAGDNTSATCRHFSYPTNNDPAGWQPQPDDSAMAEDSQYSYIEALLGHSEEHPLTLFDDALAGFDWL